VKSIDITFKNEQDKINFVNNRRKKFFHKNEYSKLAKLPKIDNTVCKMNKIVVAKTGAERYNKIDNQ
jgi:hypothetical protein